MGIMNAPPKWSMLARGSGIPNPPDQPGPGEYHQPSTLYGSHPQLPVAGRVPARTEVRKDMANPNQTPAPGYYDTLCSKGKEHKMGRYDQASAPKFTMRKKTAFGDIKFSGTEPSGPLAEKYDAIMNAPPSWTMLSRGAGIPKPPDQPGPGEYNQPSTLYGSHPQLAVAGRVPKRTEQRKGMENPNDTPSPLDYNTVQSSGGSHTFGRYDQRSAP